MNTKTMMRSSMNIILTMTSFKIMKGKIKMIYFYLATETNRTASRTINERFNYRNRKRHRHKLI